MQVATETEIKTLVGDIPLDDIAAIAITRWGNGRRSKTTVHSTAMEIAYEHGVWSNQPVANMGFESCTIYATQKPTKDYVAITVTLKD